MREIDHLALQACTDETILNKLVEQNESFIINCASAVTHRYITKSDDEWSIALMGFVQAVNDYDLDKGSFLSFSKLVIHRRLVDYIRNRSKYSMEVMVDPIVFDTDSHENEEDVSIQIAVAEQVSKEVSAPIQLEITTVNEVFKNYGFSFWDLTECSPRAKKTKTACAKAINYLLSNPIALHELREKGLLPVKTIEKNANVPRKIIDRHRKYIIAAIEILSGEYPLLAEYLRYIRDEICE
ncbi:MAG TPA: sigma factor [Lachnospiraceae bacterium]|nr:sigma factor [Lachnospiraceae bacterium]